MEIDDALAGFDVDTPEEYQTLVAEQTLDADGD